eukprot:comp19902_c0_seq1/m.24125 comp19902_c0_seq1/g.24125  ORF comp19902_c0_seq1/g.24125 comp19902_c0_seq1/m.24125 type:complete len:451 (-) comp19902_c0_seq1:66-1418(-)
MVVFSRLSVLASLLVLSDAALNIVTFNVGILRGGPPNVDERMAVAGDEIAKLTEADVMCLQELWDDQDMLFVLEGVKKTFPHVYHAPLLPPREIGTSPCPPPALPGLVNCFLNSTTCGSVITSKDASQIIECPARKCPEVFDECVTKNPECARCIMRQNVQGAVNCFQPVKNETEAKRRYSWTGGIVIASKQPLKNVAVEPLLMIGVNRSVVYAEGIVGTDGQRVGILCTHITPGSRNDTNYVAGFAGNATTNTEEKHNQIRRVYSVAREQGAKNNVSNFILAGDMNCGWGKARNDTSFKPGVDILQSDIDSWNLLVKEYLWVNVSVPPANYCTSCWRGIGSRIDHILTIGSAFGPGSEKPRELPGRVVFNENVVPLKNGNKVPLSDHFGVMVQFDALNFESGQGSDPPSNGAVGATAGSQTGNKSGVGRVGVGSTLMMVCAVFAHVMVL